MYAIVNISGKQFRAEKGKSLKVPSQNTEVGKKLSYDQVLLTNENGEVQIGNPFIKNFKVSATVLENGRDKKIIVFTNFTKPLMKLHESYKKNSVILYGEMSKEERQKSVDRFQNDDKIKIFISNLKAGGVGITLTASEVVLMNDLSFVPSDHSQAEDRAFRIGQKNTVSCLYPIFENTIEQLVHVMLQKKKNVIDTVMGDRIDEDEFLSDIINSF